LVATIRVPGGLLGWQPARARPRAMPRAASGPRGRGPGRTDRRGGEAAAEVTPEERGLPFKRTDEGGRRGFGAHRRRGRSAGAGEGAAGDGAHGAEGEFEDGGTAAGEGPAAEPAAIGVGVQADHLIHLAVGGMIAGQGFGKADAVPLVEVHGSERQGCGEQWCVEVFLILA
jgi:hypothetical protein